MNQKSNTSRNITLLLLGRAVSKFGAAFYLIALPLYLLQATGSLARTGVFFTLSSLPALAATPFLGVLVEKVNRKYLLVLCDFVTAALYAALLLFAGEDHPALPGAGGFLPLLFVVTALVNLISNAFEIGSKLMFSELAAPKTLERYNGIKSFADNAAAVIGPALGTAAFGLLGFRFVVLVAAAGYALSAAQECFIQYQVPAQTPGAEEKSWLARFWDGVRYTAGQREVRTLFLLIMVLNFFVANAEEIINPGILIQKYGISEALFGMTSSAAVVGTLAAGLFIFKNRWIDLQKNLKGLFILNSALMILIGVCSLCMTAYPEAYFALFLFLVFLLGVFTCCVNVPLISSLQTRVPLGMQGRFFALLSFSSGLLVPLGIAYTGFLASAVGADIAYILNNACVIIIVLLCGAGL